MVAFRILNCDHAIAAAADGRVCPGGRRHSPANRIVRKDQLIKMLSEGRIASDAIERIIEAAAITSHVGIVMGREIVKPKPTS
jgi:hypothetical protein